MKRIVTAAMLAAGLQTFTMAGPSAAAEMTWVIQSVYQYTVHLEFYSQNYSRAWPGGGEAYVLDDSADHSYTLVCEIGEKICFGAWSSGDPDTYWGVGMDDDEGCERCCYVCGDGNPNPKVLE